MLNVGYPMNPNDPAFLVEPPLTRREYFAAMAMQGQLSSMTNAEVVKALGANVPDPWAWSAVSAVKYADALIAELSKENV